MLKLHVLSSGCEVPQEWTTAVEDGALKPEASLSQGDDSAHRRKGAFHGIHHICRGRVCFPMPSVIVPRCPYPRRCVVASITLWAWKRRRLRERVLHSGSRWASQPSLQAGPRWSVLLRNPTHPTGQLQETAAAMGEAIVVTQGSKATEWSLEAPPISKSSQPQQKSLLCGPGFV